MANEEGDLRRLGGAVKAAKSERDRLGREQASPGHSSRLADANRAVDNATYDFDRAYDSYARAKYAANQTPMSKASFL